MTNILNISINREELDRSLFRVEMEVDGERSVGHLPFEHSLFEKYLEWEQNYDSFLITLNNRLGKSSTPITQSGGDNYAETKARINEYELDVKKEFKNWLNSENFQSIKRNISGWFYNKKQSKNVVIIHTNCIKIKKLPWHFWDKVVFFEEKETPDTEVIFTINRNIIDIIDPPPPREELSILVVSGDNDNLNIGKDIKIFKDFRENFNNVNIIYLPDPENENYLQLTDLTQSLRKNQYDWMYFCGHSEDGNIKINGLIDTSPNGINHALKQSVKRGLKLLIFNSCDGIKLAANFIPCTIVMRQKLPDIVAHEFIKHLLDEYTKSCCIYSSLNNTRKIIQEDHPDIPCVDWLPVIIQSRPELISLPKLISFCEPNKRDVSPEKPSNSDKLSNHSDNDRSEKIPVTSSDVTIQISEKKPTNKISILSLVTLITICGIFTSKLLEIKLQDSTIPSGTIINRLDKPPAQSDDISGCYQWLNNLTIEIFADRTAFQSVNNDRGRWEVNKTGKYKYTFKWSSGWRQDVNFLTDGKVEGLNTEPGSVTSYEFRGFKLKSCKNDRTFNYKSFFDKASIVAAASILTTAIISITRFTGILQPLELNVFDSLMRSRSQEPLDQNILVVEVTSSDVENEIKNENNGRSLSNESLDKLLKILDFYQPKAIGIDNYLNTDIDPEKYKQLTKYLESGKLIAVCQVGDKSREAQAAPRNAKLIGFGDILPDAEGTHNQLKVGVVRRHLLAINPQPICDPEFSLSYELSNKYLKNLSQQISIDPSQDILQTGKRAVSLLTQRTGAYQKDMGDLGYQIMLNYRSHDSSIDRRAFTTISLKKVFDLHQQQDRQLPNLIANKIIIIGTTDDSRDLFQDNHHTPYGEIRGVFLQAQMTSQLVSAAVEDRPLIWAYSYWGELLIICSLSIVGGLLFAIVRRPLVLLLSSGAIILILYFGSVASLSMIGYWFPLLPSSFGLLSTGILVRIYLSSRQENVNFDFKKFSLGSKK